MNNKLLLVLVLCYVFMTITTNCYNILELAGANNTTTTTVDDNNIIITMIQIFMSFIVIIIGLVSLQTRNNDYTIKTNNSSYRDYLPFALPNINIEPSKYYYEIYVLYYSIIWILSFGFIIYYQWYEQYDANMYVYVCGGLSLPLLLQPILYPSLSILSSDKSLLNPDSTRPWYKRYSTKANLFIATYSFIGNYWYTHYFYNVLKASYTMPSYRLNDVPIQMYFATHFYFTSYHVFSNLLLRYIITTYKESIFRTILFGMTIFTFSYFTAFMETFTISSYPYYTFHNQYMAYTIGSAFYGIYFIVSFPAFYYFDNYIDSKDINKQVTLWDTFVLSCGYGMIILLLLDFVRIYLQIPLIIQI